IGAVGEDFQKCATHSDILLYKKPALCTTNALSNALSPIERICSILPHRRCSVLPGRSLLRQITRQFALSTPVFFGAWPHRITACRRFLTTKRCSFGTAGSITNSAPRRQPI